MAESNTSGWSEVAISKQSLVPLMIFINKNIGTVHQRTLLALDPATGTAAFFSGKSTVSFFEVLDTISLLEELERWWFKKCCFQERYSGGE